MVKSRKVNFGEEVGKHIQYSVQYSTYSQQIFHMYLMKARLIIFSWLKVMSTFVQVVEDNMRWHSNNQQPNQQQYWYDGVAGNRSVHTYEEGRIYVTMALHFTYVHILDNSEYNKMVHFCGGETYWCFGCKRRCNISKMLLLY